MGSESNQIIGREQRKNWVFEKIKKRGKKKKKEKENPRALQFGLFGGHKVISPRYSIKMNGEAENTNPQTHQPQNLSLQNRRRSGGVAVDCFPVGSSVEVRTDEEGFKFVHFTATVISAPAPSKSPKKGSKKKSARKSGKDKSICVEVEYHNLLANNELDRLSESVDISCLRPAPPLQDIAKGFEVGDVVDSFYKDGWWQGVVSQVVEGGERFVVTFEDPPDVLEFGLEELRFHWDWDNGSWVRPQKQVW